MNTPQRSLIAGIAVFVAFLFGGSDKCIASDPNSQGVLTEDITPPGAEKWTGTANWTKGVVRATGIGFPQKDANAAYAQQTAKRAAHQVALRNLLETLQGVRIDSITTVKNYTLANDEIKTTISGMVRNARIIKEQPLPDGSYETTVEMDLTGEFIGAIVPKPKHPPQKLVKAQQPLQPLPPKNFSGLVVDARGTGAHAALAPRILNEEEEEAYSVAYVQSKDLADKGIVVYVPDVSSAQTHPRVTSRPLVIKALRATGKNKADLIISDADAQTIHGVPEHYKFLENAQVLVVLDQSK